MPVSPSAEYTQRLRDREAQVADFEKVHVRMGSLRVLLAAAIAVAGWLSISRHAFSLWWLFLPIAAFVAAGWYHSRVLDGRARSERAVAVYRDGLARIEDRWEGNGQTGERFNVPHHVYAADLDLFGKSSLFELLSTARTRMGEDTLAQWLLAPSAVEVIQQRHAALSELRDRLDFREALAVLGEDSRVGVHPEALLTWAAAPNRLTQRWLRWLAPLLAVLAVAFAAVWAVWGLATSFVVVVVLEVLITRSLKKQLTEIFHATEHAFANLDLLSALLARLECEQFLAPRLLALKRQLASHNLAGSQAIARLRTIVQFVESRRNPFVRFLDAPFMYSVQVAFAAEAWRRAHGHAVRYWIDGTGEIEALVSIATYCYEHPDDPFPEFVNPEQPDMVASFNGEELGHPLIPAAKCVRNSVCICGDTRVLLVSGSNMSGKSTLLRTVGINVVLAMAGAPVRARRLQLTPLQVGASIRVNDSLHEGNSRFYAEITRLRQIYGLAGQKPTLLFLLDELLQGTNSHDRRIGAEGIVRAFVELGAIGLISTHDLALTDIGGIAQGSLENVHFQDELENGKMKFDFTLREGVVTKSNGLELMRSIGLKV
ncbi:MAG TPA: mismatch repair protein [Candidatus Sulfotelmatobacter sp.]